MPEIIRAPGDVVGDDRRLDRIEEVDVGVVPQGLGGRRIDRDGRKHVGEAPEEAILLLDGLAQRSQLVDGAPEDPAPADAGGEGRETEERPEGHETSVAQAMTKRNPRPAGGARFGLSTAESTPRDAIGGTTAKNPDGKFR